MGARRARQPPRAGVCGRFDGYGGTCSAGRVTEIVPPTGCQEYDVGEFRSSLEEMVKRSLSIILLALAGVVTSTTAQTISSADAKYRVGEQATVCGKIASERTATTSKGEPTFINLDSAYPHQVFTAVVWEKDKPNVGRLPQTGQFCASGLITLYHRLPEITLASASNWSVPRATLSNDRHYTNSDGQVVHSPAYSSGGVPAGATAQCGDGTYSFSQHRQGTCSHHGGVAKWL